MAVTVNRHAVTDLALFGAASRVEALFREVKRTVQRLELDTKGTKPFRRPPRGSGGHPNVHDVIRWLDSLNTKDKELQGDVMFLKRLYVTLIPRVAPAVLDETIEPKALVS